MALCQFGSGEVSHRQFQRRMPTVPENPGRRQPGVGEDPLQQPHTVQTRRFGNDMGLSGKSSWLCSHLQIGITKDVGEIEAAFAHEALRIYGEPPARPGIQDVAMMEIAVQDNDVLRFLQKIAGHRSSVEQNAALFPGGRPEFLKPLRQGNERGRGLAVL